MLVLLFHKLNFKTVPLIPHFREYKEKLQFKFFLLQKLRNAVQSYKIKTTVTRLG